MRVRNIWGVLLCCLVLGSSCASFMKMLDEPEHKTEPRPQPKARPVDNHEHKQETTRCEATKMPLMRSAPAPRQMESVKHFSYSFLDFPSFENKVIDRVDFTVQLCNVPAPRPYGMYYQIYMKIAGNPLYFGIQTRLMEPGKGSRGPGFIFSRWGNLDEEELRVNEDGFHELGKHEGGFTGVRMPHPIKATSYEFELIHDTDNWYDLFVTPYGEEPVWVGSLRLKGNRGLSDFTLTTEAYGMNNVSTLDIPYWHLLAAVPRVNGIPSHGGRIQYHAKEYPFGTVQVHDPLPQYDDAIGDDPFLNVSYGGLSVRIKSASDRFVFP